MLDNVTLSNVMMIDIETAPCVASFDELPERMQRLWEYKADRINKYEEEAQSPADLFFERGGIYAEFGRIICISAGIFKQEEGQYQFRIKSFYGKDEKTLLQNFTEMLDNNFSIQKNSICAHNGKEFDYPYISRRCLVHSLKLPKMLDVSGKKPWETEHLMDTMNLWRFGDFKNFTSLDLLAAIFGIETPKDDIKGSDVAKVFWKDDDLERIKVYCEKDIITLARVFMHFKGIEPLGDEQLIFTDT